MLILGFMLILAGALAVLAALFSSAGTAELLGTDLNAMTIFFVGLGAGFAILWGLTLTKLGTKRSLRQRRESRKLSELSDKLDRVESERQRGTDGDDHEDSGDR